MISKFKRLWTLNEINSSLQKLLIGSQKSDADDNADPYVWRHKNTESPPAQIKPLLIFVL